MAVYAWKRYKKNKSFHPQKLNGDFMAGGQSSPYYAASDYGISETGFYLTGRTYTNSYAGGLIGAYLVGNLGGGRTEYYDGRMVDFTSISCPLPGEYEYNGPYKCLCKAIDSVPLDKYSVVVKAFTIKTSIDKGAYLDQVVSTSQSAYPKNGILGDYWFEFIGKISDVKFKSLKEHDIMRTSITMGGGYSS